MIDVYNTGFVLFLIEGTIVRYGGIYENPNYVGLLLLITIPINIALLFGKYKETHPAKIGLLLLLVISVILLLISNSRSSMIGTLVASAVTIAFINRKVFVRFISILALSLVILFFVSEIQDYLSLFLRLERAGNREYFWNAGLEIISDHPYFGVGPELFDRYFFTHMPSLANQLYESSVWSVGRPHPHNFFLLFAAENGVMGFLSAICFFILFFYFAIKTLSIVKHKKLDEYLIVVSSLGIGIGILIRSFFEVTGIITYGFITRDLPFWILFIIILHINKKYSYSIQE
ncbi:MAG: O-antigen ligase family protein [Sphingobacteriaceae bacterium]|nr:O-antigen ligase family protein [Sphingobacteriaceae bacterium]